MRRFFRALRRAIKQQHCEHSWKLCRDIRYCEKCGKIEELFTYFRSGR